jgi:hypothetical protein
VIVDVKIVENLVLINVKMLDVFLERNVVKTVSVNFKLKNKEVYEKRRKKGRKKGRKKSF